MSRPQEAGGEANTDPASTHLHHSRSMSLGRTDPRHRAFFHVATARGGGENLVHPGFPGKAARILRSARCTWTVSRRRLAFRSSLRRTRTFHVRFLRARRSSHRAHASWRPCRSPSQCPTRAPVPLHRKELPSSTSRRDVARSVDDRPHSYRQEHEIRRPVAAPQSPEDGQFPLATRLSGARARTAPYRRQDNRALRFPVATSRDCGRRSRRTSTSCGPSGRGAEAPTTRRGPRIFSADRK